MKKRLIELDECKGIAILLVSLGHILDVLVGGRVKQNLLRD